MGCLLGHLWDHGTSHGAEVVVSGVTARAQMVVGQVTTFAVFIYATHIKLCIYIYMYRQPHTCDYRYTIIYISTHLNLHIKKQGQAINHCVVLPAVPSLSGKILGHPMEHAITWAIASCVALKEHIEMKGIPELPKKTEDIYR